MLRRDLDQPWHPSYWLAALGAGGLSISFFMYLMWLVPHQGFPMPTWQHLDALLAGDTSLPAGVRSVAIVATLLMLLLALLHFTLLIWNIREYRAARTTDAYQRLLDSPSEVQLMTQPLTFAMTVNVCFALGALCVPDLWAIVEYLFPIALLAFAAIGVWSLKLYGRYLSRMLVNGGYRQEEHNHLSPLMAVFTFSMLSVGFAAPAAMSHSVLVAALAATLSILFLVIAVVSGVLILISGLQAMLQYGLQTQATPSIWMLIPIMTLLGIEWVRVQHGLSHHFAAPVEQGKLFVVLTAIFMLQLGVMLLGYRVMQLNGYLTAHLLGGQRHPVSFGLICPGVALFVMGMFWWHLVWVQGGIVTAFGVVYWLGIAVLAVVQFLTLAALLRLSHRLLRHKSIQIASME
ncbi:TsoY family (seleno)protein [Amphritea sp.]|uniref:TsoY family (seleno)protein n=1 Tax=Amphritea sp. TaxID=1872502 RepID=UPI003A93BDB9